MWFRTMCDACTKWIFWLYAITQYIHIHTYTCSNQVSFQKQLKLPLHSIHGYQKDGISVHWNPPHLWTLKFMLKTLLVSSSPHIILFLLPVVNFKFHSFLCTVLLLVLLLVPLLVLLLVLHLLSYSCCWQVTSSRILSSASCSLRSRSTSSSRDRTCSQTPVSSLHICGIDWLVRLDCTNNSWGKTWKQTFDWRVQFEEIFEKVMALLMGTCGNLWTRLSNIFGIRSLLITMNRKFTWTIFTVFLIT